MFYNTVMFTIAELYQHALGGGGQEAEVGEGVAHCGLQTAHNSEPSGETILFLGFIENVVEEEDRLVVCDESFWLHTV